MALGSSFHDSATTQLFDLPPALFLRPQGLTVYVCPPVFSLLMSARFIVNSLNAESSQLKGPGTAWWVTRPVEGWAYQREKWAQMGKEVTGDTEYQALPAGISTLCRTWLVCLSLVSVLSLSMSVSLSHTHAHNTILSHGYGMAILLHRRNSSCPWLLQIMIVSFSWICEGDSSLELKNRTFSNSCSPIIS